MRSVFRHRVVASALVLAAVFAATATASRVVRIPSQVTIAAKELTFHGKVLSGNRACEPGRRVKLLRVFPGRDEVVGRTRSNIHGVWAITPQGTAGISLARFYAKVRRRAEGAAGTIYVCRADQSRVIAPGR